MKDWLPTTALALAFAAWWLGPARTTAQAKTDTAEESKSTSTKSSATPTPTPTPSAAPAFVDTNAPVLRFPDGAATPEPLAVHVSNAGKADFDGKLLVVLRTARGVPIPQKAIDCKVPSGAVAHRVDVVADVGKLNRDDFPLGGWLVLTPGQPDKPPVRLEIKALPAAIGEEDWALLRTAALLAIATMAIAAVVCCGATKSWRALKGRMGSPKWDFTKSWSSTITLGVGALTALFAYAGLPEYGRHFGKATYGLLSTLFGALITLAPALYAVARVPVQTDTDTNTVETQYQGFVAGFLVAGLVTMMGVFAQLALFRALFDDLAFAGLLSHATADAFRWLCVVLQVAFAVYAVVSSWQAVEKQSVKEATSKAKLRRTGAAAIVQDASVPQGSQAARVTQEALPDWPLL